MTASMRRLAQLTTTALATIGIAAGTATAAESAASTAGGDVAACPAATSMPIEKVSDARSEHALLCLINRERSRAGARPLRANRCLARSALAHARDMVRRRYFAHDSRDGRGFDERILATGYAPPPATWIVGENLAWGASPAGDAAWVMRAWMGSPGHRDNLLRKAFSEIGLAAVAGAPVGGGGARATWAADFGAHSGGSGRCG